MKRCKRLRNPATAASTQDFESLANVGGLPAPVAAEMQSVRENLLAANPVRRGQTELRPSGG